MMTVNGFKQYCMSACTERASKVREYYITMEDVMFEYLRSLMPNSTEHALFVTPIERSIVSVERLHETEDLFDLGVSTSFLPPNCVYVINVGCASSYRSHSSHNCPSPHDAHDECEQHLSVEAGAKRHDLHICNDHRSVLVTVPMHLEDRGLARPGITHFYLVKVIHDRDPRRLVLMHVHELWQNKSL